MPLRGAGAEGALLPFTRRRYLRAPLRGLLCCEMHVAAYLRMGDFRAAMCMVVNLRRLRWLRCLNLWASAFTFIAYHLKPATPSQYQTFIRLSWRTFGVRLYAPFLLDLGYIGVCRCLWRAWTAVFMTNAGS